MTSRRRTLPLAIVLASLFAASLFTLAASADDMQGPSPGESYYANLDLFWKVEQDIVYSGDPLYMEVSISIDGKFIEGAHVQVTTNDPDNVTISMVNSVTDFNGRARFNLTGVTNGTDKEVIVNAIATYNGNEPVIDSYDIVIKPKAVPTTEIPDEVWYIGAGALVVVVLGAGATESGKYAIMKIAIIPLYSRVKKEEVLDHFVRGQIYGYIMSHPGQHYNAIKQELKVTNGTLSHHLKTLEMQGFIKSHRDGTYKRFYPTSSTLSKSKGIRLSDLQLSILDNLRQSPGMTQSDIAKSIGMSQQSISYNLTILFRNEIVRYERKGVRKHYFINDEVGEGATDT